MGFHSNTRRACVPLALPIRSLNPVGFHLDCHLCANSARCGAQSLVYWSYRVWSTANDWRSPSCLAV